MKFWNLVIFVESVESVEFMDIHGFPWVIPWIRRIAWIPEFVLMLGCPWDRWMFTNFTESIHFKTSKNIYGIHESRETMDVKPMESMDIHEILVSSDIHGIWQRPGKFNVLDPPEMG